MRTLAFFLALAAGVLVLVASASAVSPSVWHPLTSKWTSLGSAGATASMESSGRPPVASTPQSSPSAASDAPGRTPRPTASRAPRTYFPSISGIGTYYAYHAGQAAAARALRDFLGAGWRGMTVTVCSNQSSRLCERIKLTDFESSLIPGRLIDLDSSDFRRICGPLSRGVCEVSVSRG